MTNKRIRNYLFYGTSEMENESKIKRLEKKLLNEPNMTKEEYNLTLVDLCKEIDKRSCVDGTEAIHKIVKRLNLKRHSLLT